jgi:iron complex transport system permease protein
MRKGKGAASVNWLPLAAMSRRFSPGGRERNIRGKAVADQPLQTDLETGMTETETEANNQNTSGAQARTGLRSAALFGLVFLLALAFLASLALGSVNIPLGQVATILTGGAAEKDSWQSIILLFRLPKAITAALAGAALAVAGLQMQTLFRNPLADPYVLGISSGASLGVAAVVLASTSVLSGSEFLAGLGLLGNLSVVAAASLGAGLVMLLVMLAARRVSTMTLLILGLMFGYAAGAVVSILLHFSIAERIQTYISWTFGSFGGTTWSELKVYIPVLAAALVVAQVMVKPLNALLLGEKYARSLGLNVGRARFWIILSASVLSAAVTAFCGPIGFIGIAVPHICRSLLQTSDHRLLVPASTLLGAALALAADLIAHVPYSSLVLPLNAITSLIGAPIVIWVILRRRNLQTTFSG